MNKKYTKLYDELSKEDSKEVRFGKHDNYRLNVFIKEIQTYSKKRKIKLLDVGSRNGWLKKKLDDKRINVEYFSLDISKNYINAMKKRGINAVYGDITKKTEFKDKTFDIIILGEILEHLPNTGDALNECKRILKEEGIIIGSVPNAWSVGYMLKNAFRKDIDPSGQHIHLFDKYHIRNLFDILNLKIIKIWTGPFSFTFAKMEKFNMFLSKITNTGTKVFFVLKKGDKNE